MTILDHDGMRGILDALARGDTVREAAATVSLSEAGLWTAKRESKLAEKEFDCTRFWIEWRGHLNFFHVLLDVATEGRTGRGRPVKPPVTEWTPDDAPLPPYHRTLRTPATPELLAQYVKPAIDPLRPFPPPITPASPRPRVRPDSPLVRDLMARAAQTPANPHPLDARGNRTIISTGGMRADDPPEQVTTGRS
jgi:hypothetical protein